MTQDVPTVLVVYTNDEGSTVVDVATLQRHVDVWSVETITFSEELPKGFNVVFGTMVVKETDYYWHDMTVFVARSRRCTEVELQYLIKGETIIDDMKEKAAKAAKARHAKKAEENAKLRAEQLRWKSFI